MDSDLTTARLGVVALILGGIAIAIYWCVNSGPCGSICASLPSWIVWALPCNGPGSGQPGSSQVLTELDNTLSNLEQQSTPGACTSDDFGICTPTDASSGISRVGAS